MSSIQYLKRQKSIFDSSSDSDDDTSQVISNKASKKSFSFTLKERLEKLKKSSPNNSAVINSDVLPIDDIANGSGLSTSALGEQQEEQHLMSSTLDTTPSSATPIIDGTPRGTPIFNGHMNTRALAESQDKDCKHESYDEIKNVLATILNQNKKVEKQNKEILERVSKLEDDLSQRKGKKSAKEFIEVPNDVRYHVKMAFNKKKEKGESLWNLESKDGPFSEENLQLTKYIRTYVSCVFDNMENKDLIINKAIKTYFNSKVIAQKRSKNKEFTGETRRNQRKTNKANRRRDAFWKHVTMTNPKLKDVSLAALIPEMMSSEDEVEDENGERYFVTHNPGFRTKKFEKLIKLADKAYVANCSQRSKDQLLRRVSGEPKLRPHPKNLQQECKELFIKDEL